jgi:hypothetical protein
MAPNMFFDRPGLLRRQHGTDQANSRRTLQSALGLGVRDSILALIQACANLVRLMPTLNLPEKNSLRYHKIHFRKFICIAFSQAYGMAKASIGGKGRQHESASGGGMTYGKSRRHCASKWRDNREKQRQGPHSQDSVAAFYPLRQAYGGELCCAAGGGTGIGQSRYQPGRSVTPTSGSAPAPIPCAIRSSLTLSLQAVALATAFRQIEGDILDHVFLAADRLAPSHFHQDLTGRDAVLRFRALGKQQERRIDTGVA